MHPLPTQNSRLYGDLLASSDSNFQQGIFCMTPDPVGCASLAFRCPLNCVKHKGSIPAFDLMHYVMRMRARYLPLRHIPDSRESRNASSSLPRNLVQTNDVVERFTLAQNRSLAGVDHHDSRTRMRKIHLVGYEIRAGVHDRNEIASLQRAERLGSKVKIARVTQRSVEVVGRHALVSSTVDRK